MLGWGLRVEIKGGGGLHQDFLEIYFLFVFDSYQKLLPNKKKLFLG